MMKKIFALLLIVMISLGGGAGLHYLTAGFHLNKISFDLPVNPEWEFSINDQEFSKVQAILDQEFTYLGKGRQSYVFESADKKYVIKLFRYHLIRPKIRYFLMRFPKSLVHYAKCRIRAKREQFESWMNSYSLAFNELKDETGIVFMHLTNTERRHDKKIKIKDAIGRCYRIDADHTGFMIQKRVDLLYDRICTLVKAKDAENLERVIRAYFSTITSRHQKGVKNKDHAWTHNYGIAGVDDVYEIDAGRYSKHSIEKDLPSLQSTLLRFTFPIQEYLKENYPEFMESFNNILIEESERHFS